MGKTRKTQPSAPGLHRDTLPQLYQRDVIKLTLFPDWIVNYAQRFNPINTKDHYDILYYSQSQRVDTSEAYKMMEKWLEVEFRNRPRGLNFIKLADITGDDIAYMLIELNKKLTRTLFAELNSQDIYRASPLCEFYNHTTSIGHSDFPEFSPEAVIQKYLFDSANCSLTQAAQLLRILWSPKDLCIGSEDITILLRATEAAFRMLSSHNTQKSKEELIATSVHYALYNTEGLRERMSKAIYTLPYHKSGEKALRDFANQFAEKWHQTKFDSQSDLDLVTDLLYTFQRDVAPFEHHNHIVISTFANLVLAYRGRSQLVFTCDETEYSKALKQIVGGHHDHFREYIGTVLERSLDETHISHNATQSRATAAQRLISSFNLYYTLNPEGKTQRKVFHELIGRAFGASMPKSLNSQFVTSLNDHIDKSITDLINKNREIYLPKLRYIIANAMPTLRIENPILQCTNDTFIIEHTLAHWSCNLSTLPEMNNRERKEHNAALMKAYSMFPEKRLEPMQKLFTALSKSGIKSTFEQKLGDERGSALIKIPLIQDSQSIISWTINLLSLESELTNMTTRK